MTKKLLILFLINSVLLAILLPLSLVEVNSSNNEDAQIGDVVKSKEIVDELKSFVYTQTSSYPKITVSERIGDYAFYLFSVESDGRQMLGKAYYKLDLRGGGFERAFVAYGDDSFGIDLIKVKESGQSKNYLNVYGKPSSKQGSFQSLTFNIQNQKFTEKISSDSYFVAVFPYKFSIDEFLTEELDYSDFLETDITLQTKNGIQRIEDLHIYSLIGIDGFY